MRKKPKAVIVDIDGIVCDSFRKDFITQFERGNYEMFERLIPTYPPNAWAISLVNSLSIDHTILFVTARDSAYREGTIAWLDKHLDTTRIYSSNLYMRPAGDRRPDAEIKEELYSKFKDSYDILLAIDDSLSNCRLWKSKGITALTNTIPEES